MSIVKVYFLCTGNSCRSQMAEGFARHLGKEVLEAYSAGTKPVGVNPLAIEIMQEVGIDISSQTSDPVDRALLNNSDKVITLCGDAWESCPYVPVTVEKSRWPLEDPAGVEGTEEEVLETFRRVRDEIKQRVQELVRQLEKRGK